MQVMVTFLARTGRRVANRCGMLASKSEVWVAPNQSHCTLIQDVACWQTVLKTDASREKTNRWYWLQIWLQWLYQKQKRYLVSPWCKVQKINMPTQGKSIANQIDCNSNFKLATRHIVLANWISNSNSIVCFVGIICAVVLMAANNFDNPISVSTW